MVIEGGADLERERGGCRDRVSLDETVTDTQEIVTMECLLGVVQLVMGIGNVVAKKMAHVESGHPSMGILGGSLDASGQSGPHEEPKD